MDNGEKRLTESKKKSKSGTNSTRLANVGLTSEDVCAIIERCFKSGVRHFSYKDLVIDFTNNLESNNPPTVGEVPAISLPPKREGAGPTEEELGELLLSDPLEYERLIEKESYLNGEDDKGTQSVLRRV